MAGCGSRVDRERYHDRAGMADEAISPRPVIAPSHQERRTEPTTSSAQARAAGDFRYPATLAEIFALWRTFYSARSRS